MTEPVSPAIEDLKELVKEKGSRKAAAKELDISAAYVGELINGTRPLTDTVLEKLGYQKVVVHVKTHAVDRMLKAIEVVQSESNQPTNKI